MMTVCRIKARHCERFSAKQSFENQQIASAKSASR
jgi:hypothetical protein